MKSKTTRYAHFSLIFCLVVTNTGCGRTNGNVSTQISKEETKPDETLTGGRVNSRDPESLRYTSYAQVKEAEVLNSSVDVTPATIEMADHVEQIDISYPNASDIQIETKWKGLEKRLVFKGSKPAVGQHFKTFDITGQKPGLILDGFCVDANCKTVDAEMIGPDKTRVGMIVGTERRNIKLVLPESEPELSKNINSETKEFIESAMKGLDVRVDYMSVNLGKTSTVWSIGELGKPTSSKIEADVLETDGRCNPVATTGILDKYWTTCMMGNSRQGDIVFRANAKNPQEVADLKIPDRFFIEALRPEPQVVKPKRNDTLKGPKTSETSPRPLLQQKIPPTGNVSRAQALADSILGDCERKEVKDFLPHWLNTDRKGMKDFLALHKDSLNPGASGRAADFKSMLNILSDNNLPKSWSFVTLLESHFNCQLVTPKGDTGCWQFTAITARFITERFFPFTLEAAKLVGPSTRAASDYSNWLLEKFKGNIPLALAAYNGGPYGLDQKISRAAKQEIKKQPGFSLAELTEYKHDYWLLRHLNMFLKEVTNKVTGKTEMKSTATKDYVPKIYAAICIGHNPKQYGLDQPHSN